MSSALPLFNVHATLGAVQIGVLVSTALFGIVTVQVYVYSVRFPKDSKWIKALVYLVWVLELCHTISICNALYTLTITQYGQPQLLAIPPQSLDLAILFSGFIGPLEQGWFALRIYRFSRNLPLPLFCAVLSTVRFLGSIALATVAMHRLTIQEYEENWTWLLTGVLVVGACTDVLLAATLCFHLSRYRGDGFERTTRLVDSLMLWAIETGLITSLSAVSLVICYLAMKDNFIWIGVFTMLAGLFSNSLLASLNARPGFAQIYTQDTLLVVTGERPLSTPRHPFLEMARVTSAQSQQVQSPLNRFSSDVRVRKALKVK